MSQPLTEGRWFDVKNQKEHSSLKRYGKLEGNELWSARIQRGTYIGPGRYLLLSYEQRCPRNCCDDSVLELLTAQEVVDQCKEQMRELADTLKKAKGL